MELMCLLRTAREHRGQMLRQPDAYAGGPWIVGLLPPRVAEPCSSSRAHVSQPESKS